MEQTLSKVREMITDYIAKSDPSSIVDDIWNKISRKAEERGVTEDDVNKAIREVRASKRKEG